MPLLSCNDLRRSHFQNLFRPMPMKTKRAHREYMRRWRAAKRRKAEQASALPAARSWPKDPGMAIARWSGEVPEGASRPSPGRQGSAAARCLSLPSRRLRGRCQRGRALHWAQVRQIVDPGSRRPGSSRRAASQDGLPVRDRVLVTGEGGGAVASDGGDRASQRAARAHLRQGAQARLVGLGPRGLPVGRSERCGHAAGFDVVLIDEIGLFPPKGAELVDGLLSSVSARDGRVCYISVQGDGLMTADVRKRAGCM